MNQKKDRGIPAPIRLSRRLQHILNKYSIPSRRVIYQDMGYRAYQLAVLDDRAAGHADVK